MRAIAYKNSPFGVCTVCGIGWVDCPQGDVVCPSGRGGEVVISPVGPLGAAVISIEGAVIVYEVTGVVLLDGESVEDAGGDP